MKKMNLRNIIVLSVLGAVNVGLIVPAIVLTANGMNRNNASDIEPEEDLTGVTSAKVINTINKTVYQEGEVADLSGLMCLITQKGTKKIVKKNFELVTNRPLLTTDTFIEVKYGDFTFQVPIKVLNFANILTINRNGSYTIEAEDPEIPLDGYIEADTAWSAAHYDGVNEVTKYVESWTNTRVNPSSGRSICNIAVGSVLGFKFSVEKDCYINISARMAMYDGKKPSDLLEFRLDGEVKDDVDKALVLTHLDGSDVGAMYFNWQDWSMGTYALTAGEHIFTVTVTDFKLPNLDSFRLVATDMEGGDTININDNGKQTLLATDEQIDRSTWVKDSPNSDFVENWTNSGETYVKETSGQSIGHLADGSKIIVPIGLKGRAKVNIKPIVASSESKLVNDCLKVQIDNTTLNKEDFGLDTTLKLGSQDGVSDYWNWKSWDAGTIDLTKGSHILTITVKKSINIYGFEVTTSDYQANESGAVTIKGNGTQVLEGESGLLNRTGWSVRADFVNVGRDPVESWNTKTATELEELEGRSLCALNEGCVINIPFEVLGSCNLEFDIICASPNNLKCSEIYEVTIDGKKIEGNDTSVILKESSASQYWNWTKYNAGNIDLSKGTHTVTLKLLNGSSNIDSFRFVASNFASK